jgi:K+-transporting ATPase c subunit
MQQALWSMLAVLVVTGLIYLALTLTTKASQMPSFSEMPLVVDKSKV